MSWKCFVRIQSKALLARFYCSSAMSLPTMTESFRTTRTRWAKWPRSGGRNFSRARSIWLIDWRCQPLEKGPSIHRKNSGGNRRRSLEETWTSGATARLPQKQTDTSQRRGLVPQGNQLRLDPVEDPKRSEGEDASLLGRQAKRAWRVARRSPGQPRAVSPRRVPPDSASIEEIQVRTSPSIPSDGTRF